MTRRRIDLDAMGVDEMMRRGVAAARVGENDEALALLAEVAARDPTNADAWLWLAGLESRPQRKRAAFERVLALRPDDAEAREGLARLAEKYGQGVLDETLETRTFCAWHPDRETMLRCARCGRPICPDCARSHPVGWRCKECAHELRSPLYRASPRQVAGGIGLGLATSLGAAAIMGAVGLFWFVGFFVAPAAGTFVADAVSRGAGRKRGRALQWVAAASVLAGAAVVHWALALGPLRGVLPYGPLGVLLYAVLGTGAAFYRLR